MKHLSLPATGVMPSTFIPFRRRGIFASILGALHHARRAQTRRMLRRYKHLIDRAEQGPSNLEGGHNVNH